MTGVHDDIAAHGEGGAAGKADVFLDAWRARWPEWRVAMAFVPAAQRTRVAAWGALQQALTDAAWTGDDPTPGLAKLAWWQEELAGWAKGARRHPLGALLQPLPAPWLALSRALPRLQATRLRPGEAVAGDDAWRDVADVLSACDRALFASGPVGERPAEAERAGAAGRTPVAAPAGCATGSAVAAIALLLRAEQALLSGAAGVPEAPTAAPSTAAGAASAAPGGAALTRPRAIHAALVAARMRHPRAALPAWRVPWLAWRAARNAR